MKNILKTLFSMEGRLSRKRYWLGFVLVLLGANFAAWAVIAVIIFGLDSIGGAGQISGIILFTSFGVFSFAWMIANFWAMIAGPMKRFHDLNMSGWWVLWFLLLTYGSYSLGILFSTNAIAGGGLERSAGTTLLIVSGVSLLIEFIILGFFPGTLGPNKYGDDPLRPLGVDDVSEYFK